MKKKILVVFLVFIFFNCSNSKKIRLTFLDEYTIKDSIQFQSSILGGFSGIDFSKDNYYLIIDDVNKPRLVTSKITIKSDTISSIIFQNVIFLNDSITPFYEKKHLDLESIFIDADKNEINFVSEGSIYKRKKPLVFVTDFSGHFKYEYSLPRSHKNLNNIKHNAVFEASSKSVQKNGFWVAMEGVLKSDGEEPSFHKTTSPIRITFFDKQSKKATHQFAYHLEPISKPAKGNINLNGVTAILEHKENHFFIIERTYQSGYGAYGNIVRIFEANINEETTNVLEIDSLRNFEYKPLKKRLLFDFENVKNRLKDGIIDNIEGITFGPKLSNGKSSLILVSDDNFQIYGKQLNQFILLEIDEN